jgi:hypothetical protein
MCSPNCLRDPTGCSTDRICALWDIAPAAGATLAEMAALVPVVPRKADAWLSQRLGLMIDYRNTEADWYSRWRIGAQA